MTEQKEGFNCPPLEVLLSSPVFWRDEKSGNFLHRVHNVFQIRDDLEELQKLLDKIALTPQWNLWNGYNNWKDVLGESQFELMSKLFGDEDHTEMQNVGSVVTLLDIITISHENPDLVDNESRKKLDWFTKSSENLEFDEQLFSQFWKSKFPKLGMFLWCHCWKLKDVDLQEFYVGVDSDPSCLEPGILEKQLQFALDIQLNEGYLESRWKIQREKLSPIFVEFRTINQNLILEYLDGYTALDVNILNENVNCNWFSDKLPNEARLTDKFVETNSDLNFHFGDTFANLDVYSVLNMYIQKCKKEKRVVFFTSRENSGSEQVLQKRQIINKLERLNGVEVLENSVRWKELSEKTKADIITNAKCVMQGRLVPIGQIIPKKNPSTTDLVLFSLCDNLLNSLLKQETPKIFDKIQIPKLPELYLERKVFKRMVLEPRIFQLASELDVFIIAGISPRALASIIKCSDQEIQIVHDLHKLKSIDKNFIVLSREYSDDELESWRHDEISYQKKLKGINLMRYIHNNRFLWIKSPKLGEVVFEKVCPNFLIECKIVSELNFIRSMHSFRQNEKLILIADKSGMGKSQTLASLASKSIRENDNLFVLFIDMTNFIREMRHVSLNSRDIVSAISKMVTGTVFERNLFRFWLEADEPTVKFEIFLDGLDELPFENRQFAIDVLKCMHSDAHFVRIWVTLSDQMLSGVCSQFNCSGYKLVPFSRDEQVDWVKKQWIDYWEKSKCSSGIRTMDFSEMETFAQICVDLPLTDKESSIFGTVLKCKMIAEIYERNVAQGHIDLSKTPNVSLVDLYEQYFDRKMEMYLKDKNGLESLDMLSNPIVKVLKDSMELTHVYFSIKQLLSNEVADSLHNRLIIGTGGMKQVKAIVLEQCIVQNTNYVVFTHRSFAEFILARFTYKVICNQYFHIYCDEPVFQTFLWNELLQVYNTKSKPSKAKQSEDKSPILKYPTVCYFLNEMCKNNTDLENHCLGQVMEFLSTYLQTSKSS